MIQWGEQILNGSSFLIFLFDRVHFSSQHFQNIGDGQLGGDVGFFVHFGIGVVGNIDI